MPSLIAAGPVDLNVYKTTYNSEFTDPRKQRGFGGKTKAEKLKKAAVTRGKSTVPMIQLDTFDESTILRISSKPENGFGAILPYIPPESDDPEYMVSIPYFIHFILFIDFLIKF